VDDPAQHVPAELVRAEEVLPARALESLGLVRSGRVLGRQNVREGCHHEEHGDDTRADEGGLVLAEPSQPLGERRLGAVAGGGPRQAAHLRQSGLAGAAASDQWACPVGHRRLLF
jgi:hypothetical protein